MKISQEQKAANRQAILEAAVTQIAEKGFKAATMSRIAREAGVGEATIYNYFSTKEAILYAYYLDHMHRCVAELKTVADFNTFTLQEQLQTLFDTSLDLYLPHREFVGRTFRLVFLSPSRDWNQVKPIRAIFLAAVADMLAAAAEVGEIPGQVFEDRARRVARAHPRVCRFADRPAQSRAGESGAGSCAQSGATER